ncbi:MAG: DUF2235 domain-containing protein [Hyphomicrobiaceae bacterium]|nr:DUF2235 domain-containing protein [Hyphomicrobiaceae bacterium]
MKNIAILFDGTWNTSDSQHPSNVVKTAQLIAPRSPADIEQVIYYDAGVGSVDVAVASSINNWLGGAFGSGLMANIEEAYRFLTFNYAPGDNIFIFGFSRGAFSARSMGGLIRTCGILRRDKVDQVKRATRLYKSWLPEDDAAVKVGQTRADLPRFAQFRAENALPLVPRRVGQTSQGAMAAPVLSIAYMGVWDTVGALGVPGGFGLASLYNRRYRFHDLNLSSMVASARHALAIDERRRTFEATVWDNIPVLNADAMKIDPMLSSPPYLQQWFPGDHGSVGGSGDVNGHWQSSLVWVVEGAMERGLGVDHALLDAYRRDIDVTASLNCMTSPTFNIASIAVRRWRKGPKAREVDAVSEHAKARIRTPPDELYERKPYRPPPLKEVIADLLKL